MSDIKQGTFVRIIPREKYGAFDSAKVKKYSKTNFIFVSNGSPMDYNTKTKYVVLLIVNCTDIKVAGYNTSIAISTNDIEIINESKETIIQRQTQLIKKFNSDLDKSMRELIKPRESYLSRTLNFDNGQELYTNYSWIQKGLINKDNSFRVYSNHSKATCCSLTKTNEDLSVYIPKFWLNYYGYNSLDLVRWLKFIKETSLDFDYTFNGLCSLPKEMNINQLGSVEGKKCYIDSIDNFFNVQFKGHKAVINTYVEFILVRFIYNYQYWDIPGLAMQIKANLKGEITNEQAIYMALLSRNYFGYYCLSNNTGTSFTHPFKQRPLKEAIETFTRNGVNNGHFYTKRTTKQHEEMQEFFKTKNYKGLLEYLKTF